MKIIITSLFLFSVFNIKAQSLNDFTTIYRYVDNIVYLNNRFEIDTTTIKHQFKLKFINKDSINSKYCINTMISDNQIKFEINSLINNQIVNRKIKCYIKNPEYQVKAYYQTINDSFDITQNLNRIRLIFKEKFSAPYFFRATPTSYSVLFPNGQQFDSTTLEQIKNDIYRYRPSFIKITNFKGQIHSLKLYSNDTIRIPLLYPKSTDTLTWCFEDKRQTIKLNGNDFKDVPDTLVIHPNGCLFLNLNAGGTENTYVITDLKSNKSIYYHQMYGNRNTYDIDLTNKFGEFKVELMGDGGSGELLLKIIE